MSEKQLSADSGTCSFKFVSSVKPLTVNIEYRTCLPTAPRPSKQKSKQTTTFFTGIDSDGYQHFEASFRGRCMKGCKLILPNEMIGAVLDRQTEDRTDDENVSVKTTWKATATFTDFYYWNHDNSAVASDGVRRCLEWASLASQSVHRKVDPDEVARAIPAVAKE